MRLSARSGGQRRGGGKQMHYRRLQVLDVAARGDEEVIDVRVAAQDLERGGLLRERRRVLRPGVSDIEEGCGRRRVPAVVRQPVAHDLIRR